MSLGQGSKNIIFCLKIPALVAMMSQCPVRNIIFLSPRMHLQTVQHPVKKHLCFVITNVAEDVPAFHQSIHVFLSQTWLVMHQLCLKNTKVITNTAKICLQKCLPTLVE